MDHSVDYYTYLGEAPNKEIKGTNANCMVLPPWRDWHYALLQNLIGVQPLINVLRFIDLTGFDTFVK